VPGVFMMCKRVHGVDVGVCQPWDCTNSVFVKDQIHPNTGKCDPRAVRYDIVPGVHVGNIVALTKTLRINWQL
jgi:hypothetical protein